MFSVLNCFILCVYSFGELDLCIVKAVFQSIWRKISTDRCILAWYSDEAQHLLFQWYNILSTGFVSQDMILLLNSSILKKWFIIPTTCHTPELGNSLTVRTEYEVKYLFHSSLHFYQLSFPLQHFYSKHKCILLSGGNGHILYFVSEILAQTILTIDPMRRSWGNQDCLVWRRGGSGLTLLLSITTWKEFVARWGSASSPGEPAMGQEDIVRNWIRGGLGWTLGRISP